MADDDRIGELERSFRRAGLPTFVRGYSARRAFAKALPLLAIVFVLEILNALNSDFDFWTNVGVPGRWDRDLAGHDRDPQPGAWAAVPLDPSAGRRAGDDRVRAGALRAPIPLREAEDQRDRHARGQRGAPRSRLPGVGIRRGLDPRVGRAPVRESVRRIAHGARARALAPPLLSAGDLLHDRDVADLDACRGCRSSSRQPDCSCSWPRDSCCSGSRGAFAASRPSFRASISAGHSA